MKKFFLLVGAVIMLFCTSCKKDESKESIVTRIDIQEMRKLYLSDFQIVREFIRQDYLGTEYLFKRESDSESFYMQIGIAESDKDAQVAILNYVKDVSGALTNGPHLGESVGDEYWWNAKFEDANILEHIVFVRKNVLIVIGGGNHYDGLESLAKNIDDDILKKASYIDFENIDD